MTRQRLDEDALLAIAALGSIAVGGAVGAAVVKAIRNIKAFMSVGKKDAAEAALNKLSKDDQRILRQLATERAGRDARRAAQRKPAHESAEGKDSAAAKEARSIILRGIAGRKPGEMNGWDAVRVLLRNGYTPDEVRAWLKSEGWDADEIGELVGYGKPTRKPKNEASEYDDLIGREWTSKDGPRKVVGIALVRGEPRLRIQTGDANQHELLPPAELEGEIKRDTQQAARKPAAAVPEPAFAYQAFLDTMSPMQAARAKAALLKNRIHRGDLMTVSAIVSKLVASGSTVQDSKTGRRLVAKDGSYLDEKQITKFGMDLAAHLTRKDEAADPVWAHYAAPNAGKHVPTGSPNYDAHMASKPKTWTLVGVNHADVNLAGVRETLSKQYNTTVVTVRCTKQPERSVKQPRDAGKVIGTTEQDMGESIDEMAKLSARGRTELLRYSKEIDTPDGDLTTWSRTTTAYMSDGRVLKKRDVRFKPDSFSENGRKHSYGWKDDGRMKPALVQNPAALRRALEKLRDDVKAKGYEIEADTLSELPQSPLTGGGMGEDMDEGMIDFHAKIPQAQAASFMQIVNAYAESHIVGAAGPTKKGVFIVNGTLSDEKGRRGNFIDAVLDRGIKGVSVGRKLIETDEERAQALAEGRSTTPPYVYGMFNASGGSISTEAAWRTKAQYGAPGYGKPNEANLKKQIDGYNESLQPGGANDHLAELGMERMTAVGGYIRRNEGRGSAIVAKWGKLPARLQGDVWESKGDAEFTVSFGPKWLPVASKRPWVLADAAGNYLRENGASGKPLTFEDASAALKYLRNDRNAAVFEKAHKAGFGKPSTADEADVMEVLAPFQCIDEAVELEPEATEIMRISTRPKPQPESARSPYAPCSTYPSDSYRSFCVYDDGTVVRDGYKDGRSTRAVIARVDAAALADTVSALKALAGEFNPDYGIADISMSVSESLDEAMIDTGNADVPEIGFVRGNYYLKTAKGLKNSPAEKGDRAKRRTRFREMLRNEFNVSNADALIQKLDAMDEGLDDQSYNRYGANAAAAWMSYVRKIKNPAKKTYAKNYLDFCLGIDKTAPERGELSYMAAQAVRLELAEFGIEPNGGPDGGGKDEAVTYDTRWGLVEVAPRGLVEARDRFPALGVSSLESALRAEAAGFVLEGTEVGQEILRQLGGGKFVAMTGAKNFVAGKMDGKESLRFSIGKNKTSANVVIISLNAKDLYDIKFLRSTRDLSKEPKVIAAHEDVFVENLGHTFTEVTGLYISLGTMGRKPTNEAQDPAVKSTSARVKSYFKKHGPKDVRVRGSLGKSTFIEAWISRFNPANPHTLADVPGFDEDVRRKALVIIYGKDMGTSAGNVSSHQITMSASQWNRFLDQLEGKPSTNESEDGRQVAYLTGDDAERALKSMGSPNKANVALWLRKNLSRLDGMGTQDGGEFEDDYESSAVRVNVEGVPYTVRIGDDFVVVFCDESVDEAKVQMHGATYTLVKKNADGTATLRNDSGNEFDTEPGEKWTELADAPARVSGPDPRKLSRAAYIAAEKKAMQGTRQGNLDAVVARIEREYQTKALPAGVSKVQHLLTAPRLKAADRALRTAYNVAKQTADTDYRGDEAHWGRVWDRMNAKDESVDPMAAIRKVLVQNPGRYYTADQLAHATGASSAEVFKAASRLVTQGTAKFKRGEGYSLAGNANALQLPAERAHQLRISDRRTNDYTQSDASKAARRKREESLSEEFAVVRGERDDLEYWTGESWTDERADAKLFDTQEESDAEAERLEQADETTTSAGVGGFRTAPLGKRPRAPINVGSVPDVTDDDEADEDDLDESEALPADVTAFLTRAAAAEKEDSRGRRELLAAKTGTLKNALAMIRRHCATPDDELGRAAIALINRNNDEHELAEGDSYSEPKKRAAVDARMKESRLNGLREAVRSGDKKRIGMYLEAAERDGYGAEARQIAKAHPPRKDESMGVGDTSIEVVKRGGKWRVIPPDGTAEMAFDDKGSAVEAAQMRATRENYAVVVTIGEAKSANEGLDEKLTDFQIDIEWQEGNYTVTFPELRGPVGSGYQDDYTFDTLDAALALARAESARQNFIVVVWNLKPGDTLPSLSAVAEDHHNEQERAPRSGDSPARPSAPKAEETRREALSFTESQLERYVLAAQAAGVDLNTPVLHEGGSYSLDIPTTKAVRVRELLGVS